MTSWPVTARGGSVSKAGPWGEPAVPCECGPYAGDRCWAGVHWLNCRERHRAKILGEKTILTADTGEFTLTSHKVRFRAERGGRAQVTSIMLEHVTSCDVHRSSNPVFLAIASLVFVFGLWASGQSSEPHGFFICLAIGLVFVAIYFLTRRQYLVIASPSSKIYVRAHTMPLSKLIDAIDDIEAAKNARYLSAHDGEAGA